MKQLNFVDYWNMHLFSLYTQLKYKEITVKSSPHYIKHTMLNVNLWHEMKAYITNLFLHEKLLKGNLLP